MTAGESRRSFVPRHITHALAFLLCLVLLACTSWCAKAFHFDAIRAAPRKGTVTAWSTSVAAVRALEAAIESETVHRQVRAALENISTGFLHCSHNVYRCDDDGNVVGVVLDGLRDARVNWAAFPSTVKHITLRHCKLAQSVVLAQLPRQLEEFSAVDTRWTPASLLAHPFNALRHPGEPRMPCGPGARDGCVFALQTLRCESCGLTAAYLSEAPPFFPRLTAVNLNNNSLMTFDVRSVPPSVRSLQVSHARLGQLDVTDVLARLPPQMQQLNISYTGVRFAWDMLRAAMPSLLVVDFSGLSVAAKGDDGTDARRRPAPLRSLCDGDGGGFSPAGLYVSHCGIEGPLPSFTHCTRLVALEMSHNNLSALQLEQLPASLEVLHLNNNAFAETLHVAQLPRRLRSLDLSFNRLTGSVSMADLPQHLAYLDVSRNALSGRVNLTQLPEAVKFVYLQHNYFTGEADLVDIPLGIRIIMIHHNNWDYRLPAP